MNLTPDELIELNNLLKSKNLNIPDFRRDVAKTGLNYLWLHKHIQSRNKNLSIRLRELLKIV